MATSTTLNFNLYRTNDNGQAGHGTMVLTGPDGSGYYEAEIQELVIGGNPPFEPEEIKGPSQDCDGVTQIQLFDSQRDDIKMLLTRNPFESRVSYAGSASLTVNTLQIFNLSAVVA